LQGKAKLYNFEGGRLHALTIKYHIYMVPRGGGESMEVWYVDCSGRLFMRICMEHILVIKTFTHRVVVVISGCGRLTLPGLI
jgi:hypothetical protein